LEKIEYKKAARFLIGQPFLYLLVKTIKAVYSHWLRHVAAWTNTLRYTALIALPTPAATIDTTH